LKFQPSFLPIRQFPAVVVDDADLVVGKRLAAGGKEQGGASSRRRFGSAASHERAAPHPVNDRCPPRRLQRQSDRALGQSVHRRHGFRPEAVRLEAGDEPFQVAGLTGSAPLQLIRQELRSSPSIS
jgi:hypothetical protein